MQNTTLMTCLTQFRGSASVCLLLLLLILTGCLTPAKLDRFVSAQYGNELPKANKKKKAELEVVSSIPAGNSSISTTVNKTDKFLPLLFYWKYDHRKKCSLNPAIAEINFANAIHSAASKELTEKLKGRKLELMVRQAPSGFSVVVKEDIIWVVYAINWTRIYIEPDPKDFMVDYKVSGGEQEEKKGTITIRNTETNKDFRFFQSWKSATSEYLARYNYQFTTVTKSLAIQLANEL